MKRIGLFIGLALSILSVIGVYAADITRATYYGNLQITNNGSAATNQSATFTLNTTTLINAGFINASLNNTAILNDAGADTPFMPGFNGSNPWAVWVSSITAGVGGGNATLPYTLYTGGNQSMASQLRYFPGAAGMNTTDNASLELGANFTINQTAFIDTSAGANKTLVYKPGAITTNVTGTGNISVTPSGLTQTSNLTPTANGTTTNITNVTVGYEHWQALAANTSGNLTVWQKENNVYETDTFNSGNYTGRAGNIDWIAVYFVASEQTGAANGFGKAAVKVGGNLSYGGEAGLTTSWVTYSSNFTTNPNNGQAWTWVNVQGLEIGVSLRVSNTNGNVSATQVWAVIQSTPVLTASGVGSGNHTIISSLNSGNFSLSVDGSLSHNLTVNGTITNTANDWQFFTANATPYVSNMTITINGTQQGRWEWQYSTTFTDLTGNGHTATPTFRTAGSSSNVTANLTSYTPYTQSTSTPTSPNASASNITIAFTQPSNLYSELNITMPGATWWNGILDNANIPRAIFWFPWLFGWTCLIGLATHRLTKSLLVQGFVMAFLLILFSLMGGFGYWVAIEFIILALAFIIGEKQYGF